MKNFNAIKLSDVEVERLLVVEDPDVCVGV